MQIQNQQFYISFVINWYSIETESSGVFVSECKGQSFTNTPNDAISTKINNEADIQLFVENPYEADNR